ncbi:MAG TPA: hypothetical protein VG738_07845 [Chitinophagaceae bacterium]|nr:hypothetical protein [Chitinophagaceae bacterium]
MKQLLLMLLVSSAAIINTKAQCLTHVKYSAGKMEILDTALNVLDTKEEGYSVETRADGFTGIREEELDDSLHGVLKSVTCNWKEPFKNGTITMVCDVQGKEQAMSNATITIEAKEGHIYIYLRAQEQPDKVLRLVVDKYEEIK